MDVRGEIRGPSTGDVRPEEPVDGGEVVAGWLGGGPVSDGGWGVGHGGAG